MSLSCCGLDCTLRCDMPGCTEELDFRLARGTTAERGKEARARSAQRGWGSSTETFWPKDFCPKHRQAAEGTMTLGQGE
jgi:hypothetical protein